MPRLLPFVCMVALFVACQRDSGAASARGVAAVVDLDELADAASIDEVLLRLGASATELFELDEPTPVGRVQSIAPNLRVHYAPSQAAVQFLVEDRQKFYVTAARRNQLIWARGIVTQTTEGYGMGEGWTLEQVESREWFPMDRINSVLEPRAGVGLWLDHRLQWKEVRTVLAALAQLGVEQVALQRLTLNLRDETLFGRR